MDPFLSSNYCSQRFQIFATFSVLIGKIATTHSTRKTLQRTITLRVIYIQYTAHSLNSLSVFIENNSLALNYVISSGSIFKTWMSNNSFSDSSWWTMPWKRKLPVYSMGGRKGALVFNEFECGNLVFIRDTYNLTI